MEEKGGVGWGGGVPQPGREADWLPRAAPHCVRGPAGSGQEVRQSSGRWGEKLKTGDRRCLIKSEKYLDWVLRTESRSPMAGECSKEKAKTRRQKTGWRGSRGWEWVEGGEQGRQEGLG